MRILILKIILLALVHSASAQKPFPENYIGKWKGALQILSKDGLTTTDTITVLFEVAPINKHNYLWRTTYETKTGPIVKDYKLITDTVVKGHYIIDEGDSIALDSYYIGEKLYCTFEVEGQLFFSTYQKQAHQILFEIAYGPFTNPRKTGDIKLTNGIVPKVMVYKTEGIQRAILKLQ